MKRIVAAPESVIIKERYAEMEIFTAAKREFISVKLC
jgi:hypothetical protein